MVEENKKEPGFWGRTEQVLKVGGAIAIIAIAGALGGPVGAAVAIGTIGVLSHKRNAKNNATKDNSEKENEKPSFWKRALFVVGSIALGALIGGPVGIIAAAALVISDAVSKGKLTEWSGDVLKAPFTLVKEGYSKIREAQGLSRKDVKVPEEVKGNKTEKEVMGKNQGGQEVGDIGQRITLKVQKQVEAEGRVLRRSHSMNDLSGPGLQDKASKLVENLKQQNSPVSKQRNDEKTNTDEKPVVGPATAKHARGEQDAKQVKGEVLRR